MPSIGRDNDKPESFTEFKERLQPADRLTKEYNINLNRRYGHADNCLFGTQNSGMCNCGKGFQPNGNRKGTKPGRKTAPARAAGDS